MAPRPLVSFSNVSSTDVFLGNTATYTLRFDNQPTDPADVGYAPYIDLILPHDGIDGGGPGDTPTNDGLSFIQALHLGVPLAAILVEFDAAGSALHPFALDAQGNPLVIHGTPGDQLVVLKLPFGSFTASQTAADIQLTLGLSDLADLGQPLQVIATGGFAYGADEFNNPAGDPVTAGDAATLAINPIVATLHVDYWGPEQETATGPSYPRTWVAWAELANGQSFDNLTLTDVLPDGVVLTRTPQLIDGLTGHALPGTVEVVQNADGSQTVTGAFQGTILAGAVKPMLKMDWYVTEFLGNTALRPNTPVLDPGTGAFRSLQDNARLQVDWIPIDTRDRADLGQPQGTSPSIRIDIDPAGAEDVVTAKSIAIQKGVALVGGDADHNGVADWQPGGDLQYTLNGQVSNYFEMKDLVVNDTLGDGQTFDAAQVPTISIHEGGRLVYSGAVLYSVGVGGAGAAAKTAAGKTPLVFDISGTMLQAGLDAVLDGNGGELGAVPHATAYQPASITIAYHTTLDAGWTGTVPGDKRVDQGDPVRNDVLYDGAVYLTGRVPEDDSDAHVTLPVSTVSKAIYAINGNTAKGTTGLDAPAHTQAGDLITFRIGLDMPLTSAHKVTLADFLPLPVLHAADADADPATPAAFSFVNLADAGSPAAGVVKFGPADTFHLTLPGQTPKLSFDVAGNSLTLDFGDVADPTYQQTKLDLLMTLRVNDLPFGDGLLLTNQVTSRETNSFDEVSASNAIIQFVLGEPILKITKGVIGSDNPASIFLNTTTSDEATGPLAFTAPGSAGPRFAGTISSDLLSAKPIDADLGNADAGDTVSFAIVIENKGQGWRGAFDTLIRDILPTGYVGTGSGAEGINLQVTDGAGKPLAWKEIGGGLFDAAGGIELIDPAGGNGAIGSYDAASGANIAVITYDLRLASTLPLAAVPLRNTAEIAHYAAEEGGIDRVPSDILPTSDDASIANLPAITKLVSGSSLGVTGTAQGHAALTDLAIGETVTYTLTVRLPEGTATALQLQDLLPNVNGQLQAISATLTSIGASLSGGSQFASGKAAVLSDRDGDGVADTLSFDFGTVANAPDNLVDGNDLITVQVVARLTDTAANRALDGQVLTNTATLSFQAGSDPADRRSVSATADVDAVKPHLILAKDISQATGDAADIVTYTIELRNQAQGYDAAAFDISIDDNLLHDLGINASVIADSVSFAAGSAAASVVQGNAAGATALQVTAAQLDPGQFLRFTFKAQISDTVPSGTTITNTATASTLPGTDPQEHVYVLSDDAAFRVNGPSITKSVWLTSYADTGTAQGSSAADADVKVNEEITYRITITLPEGTSRNLHITDLLADSLATGTGGGLLSYVARSARLVSVGSNLSGGSLLAAPTITATDTGTPNGHADQIRFDFGTIYNDPHLTAAGGDDIVVELRAVAADVTANQAGDRLVNSAYAETDLGRSTTRTATVDFVEPSLLLDKSVDIATGNAGDIATYTVTIRHAASSSADAYDLDLSDLLPGAEAYVAGSHSTLAGLSIAGGAIRLHQDTFALGSAPITFSYQAKLLDNVVNGQVITNTALLDWQTASATQAPSPGRSFTASDPATVTVALGNTIAKTVDAGSNTYTTGSNAAAGETFTYTITATLAEGAQHLVLTDLLPAGLTFVSASLASIGSNITAAAQANGTWNATTRKVTFDFGDVVNAGENVTDARDQVIVQVVAQVPAGAAAGTALTNTGLLSSSVPLNGYGVMLGTAQPDLASTKTITTVAARIGDLAFIDKNGNGIQDSGESGVNGLIVKLLDPTSDAVLQTTVTATIGGVAGSYAFSSLVPGQYKLQFVPSGTTSAYLFSPADAGTDDAKDSDANPSGGKTGTYTLTNGANLTSVDAGLYLPITIGDHVFEDVNGNKLQDAGDKPLAGITVQLLDSLNLPIAGRSVVTGADGLYSFSGLAPGKYAVQFTRPAGSAWVITGTTSGATATDSDPNTGTGITVGKTYASGASDGTIDAGFYLPASFGDKAWVDTNGNGLQDAGEAGLAGVTVKLFTWGTTTQVGTTQTTATGGGYGFTGLRPGDYYATVTAPAGYLLTRSGAGDGTADSDALTSGGVPSASTGKITLTSGQNDRTIDIGAWRTVTIGDRVWLDANGNGRQDAGEPGIADVAVRLLHADGTPTGLQTTTLADGSYDFTGLVPGDYRVAFTAPAGLSFTRPGQAAAALDSDADQGTGISGIHTLASGGFDDGVDAGLYRRVTIGSRVWEDVDGDGLQGSDEPSLDGVRVTLVDDVTGSTATQVTVGGAYLFTDLPPGRYHVSFTAPHGWRFTQQVAGDAAHDSNARPDGSTGGLDLTSGGADLTQDAGLYRPGSLAGHISLALPPGICDFKLPGAVFAGVTVRLLDNHGVQVASAVTDHAGGYIFAELAPARYTLEYVLPGELGYTAGGTATEPAILHSGENMTGLDRILAYRTGSLLDGTPLVVTGGAYDVKNVSQYIALPEGGVVNLNVAGNFIVAGVGNLNANGNVGGQYVVGGTGNNVLHSGPDGGSILVGGRGSNIFEGSADPDIMVGGCGPNNMQALGTSKAWLAGYDILLGGPSGDVLESNDSLALIYGGGGNEDIHGSGTLIGGTNDGTIHRDAATGELSGLRIGDLIKGGNQADTFIYQKGDGVQWIEAVHPEQGDTVQVYGYAGPTATGRLNGMDVLYFGEDAALIFNSPIQPGSIAYHPFEAAVPGALGHIAPLPPVVLAPGVNRFYGTEGDDIAVATTGTTFRGNGGDDVLIGSNAADVFDGGDGSNTMIGKNGADLFYSGNGDNAIDGGGGTDRVAYGFATSEASVVKNADGSWTVQHLSGGAVVKTDLLRDVETLGFADGDVTIAAGKAAVAPTRDFDGDGNNDYLFRAADGSAAIWHMDGQSFVGGGTFANPGNAWQIAGTGDFDGDGRADILWRNATDGGLSLWLMDGLAAKSTTALWNPGADWKINAVGDFNGDGRADILWRAADGTIAEWLMDGADYIGGGSIANVANDWFVAGSGDFNGDGKSDLLWRHGSGAVSEWWMGGTSYLGGASFGSIDTSWHIVGTGDFNGDTKSDILWRHDGGAVSLWLLDGGRYLGGGTLGNPGGDWKVAGIDDFNGDDRADILWRNDNGAISVWMMDGMQGVGGGFVANPGALWHLV
ncbi:isopeptide-forming domain-containing fimbrial protein [Dankookia rubra]|uniref:Isopeptide-forming domain-containing fimbrial protein n=1 Tax=Dankookia rubra TaxID=1442381 RepID=A0A4V3AAP4_9PROT|nr:SdrD B-like domain-containing protein [Dankookia rubra]TDH64275.1 isopeptide-forming domain-containing fimbrial protein [Dankookia rubra]